jgi:hypothetical protein
MRGRRRKDQSAAKPEAFDEYVPHPRYGQGPRYTGLHVERSATLRPGEPLVYLHWHGGAGGAARVPGTAVVADVSRQVITTMGVTHYFDERRVCAGCQRPFLFFADEQKHWYEELRFSLEADCKRCVPCRKEEQVVSHARARYEELTHVADRTPDLDLEMAECCLLLVEAGVFGRRQTEHVRALLRRAPAAERRRLLERVAAIETAGD